MRDLTAVLLPKNQVPNEVIERLVVTRGYGDVYLRIAPLDAVGLVQIEVLEAGDGRPSVDPALVQLLSADGKAAFVHVNHQAQQAIVHPFVKGLPNEGWMGKPGDELEAKLAPLFGKTLAEIVAADDGTWRGFGLAASRTRVYVNGLPPREVPPGFPTGLDAFRFHDRGGGLPDPSGTATDRMAFFAYDRREAGAILSKPGKEIPEWLMQRGRALGPIGGLLPSVIEELEALGDKSPKDAQCSTRVLELVAMACARVHATGDSLRYWDERVLPIATLSVATPTIEEDDLEELDEYASVWHAIVEVLPFGAPPNGEGALISQLGDDEIGALSPWAKRGEEYQGAIFILDPTRLLTALRDVSKETIEELERRFITAWHAAVSTREGINEFAQKIIDKGEDDQARVLSCLAELRTCLELANGSDLQMALLFYEAGAESTT